MTTIKLRRGTQSEWDAANPVLADGEQGLITDTGEVRAGDGATAFADLDPILSGTYRALIDADETVTVGSGGDYATINAALEALSRDYPSYVNSGRTVTVNLLTGFTMAEQVILSGVDLSWITLTSDDATVTIDRSALSESTYGTRPAFAAVDGASLPAIGVLFNMDTSGTLANTRGFRLRGGYLHVLNGAGIDGGAERLCEPTHGSRVVAPNAVFRNGAGIGVRPSNSSIFHGGGADISGNAEDNVDLGISCLATLSSADLTGAGRDGFRATGPAMANLVGADVSNAVRDGVSLPEGGMVDFTNGVGTGCGQYGVTHSGPGGVNAPGADCSTATTAGYRVSGGGQITLDGSSAGTLSQPANLLLAAGVIHQPVTETLVQVKAGAFGSVFGTPTSGEIVSNRNAGWLFPDSSIARIETEVWLPGDLDIEVDFQWVNTTTNSGDVLWQVRADRRQAGDDMDSLATGRGASTITASGQYLLRDDQVAAWTASEGYWTIIVERVGDNANDTLTGDAGLWGIRIRVV